MLRFSYCSCLIFFSAISFEELHTQFPTTYAVPEFFHYQPQYSRDTAFVFRCYDKKDSIMTNVTDYDNVYYYSLFKEYIDSFNIYKDPDGSRHFLPVSYIVRRYDRLGTNRWMTVQYPGNKYSELKDDRSVTVRTDTVRSADTTKIFRCYRTTMVQY